MYIFLKKIKTKKQKKNVKKLIIRRNCKHWEVRQKLEDIITADVFLQGIYWFTHVYESLNLKKKKKSKTTLSKRIKKKKNETE